MKIEILIPKWIDSKVQLELFNHIKSLCYLLAEDTIKVRKHKTGGIKK